MVFASCLFSVSQNWLYCTQIRYQVLLYAYSMLKFQHISLIAEQIIEISQSSIW